MTDELQRLKEQGDIEKALETARQLISQHLQQLEKYGGKKTIIQGREHLTIPYGNED